MSYSCPITGEAIVTRIGERLRWDRADPEIHVLIELLEDPDTKAEITKLYEICEPCPYGPAYVRHARLWEPT